MSNPDLSDKCGGCQHPFSGHYLTFGGDSGCSSSSGPHSEHHCTCKGFMVIFKPTTTAPFLAPHPPGAR